MGVVCVITPSEVSCFVAEISPSEVFTGNYIESMILLLLLFNASAMEVSACFAVVFYTPGKDFFSVKKVNEIIECILLFEM